MLWFLLVLALLAPARGLPEVDPESVDMSAARLSEIERVVSQAIAAGKLPGAVVIVGRRGKIVYRRAFGQRALEPAAEPMTVDTIFDLASLTKPLATAPSVMLLVERGRLRLSDPLGLYFPELEDPAARRVTVQELLTHTSGYGSGLDRTRDWQGLQGAVGELSREYLRHPPGTHFEYSDINYIALGLLVQRIAGQPLDQFSARHLFGPLQMSQTGFGPRIEPNVAPTERRAAVVLRGVVHDHVAARMGGVGGHAGLFATADDVALFAQMLLDQGGGVLSPASVARMTRPVVVSASGHTRGLGLDIDSPYSANRGELFPRGSFGHTGWTGTSLWVDPTSEIFVVFLSNRVHPDGKGDVTPLRARVSTLAAGAATDQQTAWRQAEQRYAAEVARGLSELEARLEKLAGLPPSPLLSRRTLNGIDILQENGFRELAGMRVGVVTNHTGRNRQGVLTVDLLHKAPGVRLVRIFSPEHGLRGQLDEKVPDGVDPLTGLPVVSLYGERKRPRSEDLEGLDALVYDIQDCGTRYYTYSTTLRYLLEEGARAGLPVFVLDRPNPLGGEAVEGPVADAERDSFTCPHTLPVRHGMTMGELARMFNAERKIGADLRVIAMDPWARSLWFDQTQQEWVNPSPNLRGPAAALLYPGVGLWEATNLSVGRGTDRPFEQLGAPWLDADRFALLLNEQGLSGVRFVPVRFTPQSSVYAGEQCRGVQILVTDRARLRPVRLGMELAAALLRLHPRELETEKLGRLLDNADSLRRLLAGETPAQIEASWEADLERFRKRRARFLLY